MQGLGGQGPHPPPQPAHPAGSTRVTPPENADEATSSSGDGSAKKGEPPFRACLLCRDAHTACDGQRPCRRCARLGKELQCRDAPTRKRGRRPQPPLATDLPVLLPQPPGGHGAAAAAAAKPLPLLRHLPTVVAAAAATQPLVLPPHLLQPPTQAGNPALSHHHRPPQPQPQVQPTMTRAVAPAPQQPQAMPPSRHHNYHQPQPLPPQPLPPQQQQKQAPPSVSSTTQPPPRGAGDTSTTLTHSTTANVSPSRATAQAGVACSAARWDDGRGLHAHHRGGHHLKPRYDGDNGDGDEGAERRQRKRMKTTDEHEGKGKGESEDDGEGEGVKNEDEKNEKNEDEMNESEGEGDGNAPVTRRMMREMEKKLGLLAQLVEMMSGEMRSLRSESHRLRGAVKKMKGHRKQSDQLLAQLTMAQKQQQLHQQQHHHQLHLQQNHHHQQQQQQQQQQLTEQQQYSNQQWVNHLHQSPWIVDPPGHQRAVQEGFGDRGSLLLAPYSPAHGWASSSLSSSSSLYSSASSSSSSPTSSSSSSPASPPGSHQSLRSSFSFELSVLHAGVSPALLLEAREALPFLCDYDISPNRFAILDLRYPICVSINPLSDTPPIMVYVNDAFTSLVGYAREELIGLPYTNIGSYNTNHRPQVPEFIRKPPMTSGDVFSFSPLVRCKDGRLLRLADRSQFFYDHYGNPHCAILCATSWHEDTMKESERFNKWLPLRQLAYHSADPHLGDDDEANGASSG